MKSLYLDCSYGISGDMTLSALIDLGADLQYIERHLKQLPLDPFEISIKKVDKRGISSNQLVISFDEDADHVGHTHSHDHNHSHDHSHNHGHHHTHEHSHDHDHHSHERAEDDGHHSHSHRKAADILSMIEDSNLPSRVKKRSKDVFDVIAEAEGKIHGMDRNEVHFHEVGAMDSIIDIIGVCLALESLDVSEITAAPVPTGYGKIMIAHGLYPVPAPATAEILRGVPLLDFDVKGELTTPTGAAFLRALADDYGRLPAKTIDRIGYGSGKKDFEHPNVLRAFLFEGQSSENQERINVLECQLDDTTGEVLGYTMDKLLKEGALDVYFTSVSMKKNRPGTLVTVLAKPEDTVDLESVLLLETSTFGVRKSEWSRRILERRFEKITTKYGDLTVKVGTLEGNTIKIFPEYEDVKEIAIKNNVSLIDIYEEAKEKSKAQIHTHQ